MLAKGYILLSRVRLYIIQRFADHGVILLQQEFGPYV